MNLHLKIVTVGNTKGASTWFTPLDGRAADLACFSCAVAVHPQSHFAFSFLFTQSHC